MPNEFNIGILMRAVKAEIKGNSTAMALFDYATKIAGTQLDHYHQSCKEYGWITAEEADKLIAISFMMISLKTTITNMETVEGLTTNPMTKKGCQMGCESAKLIIEALGFFD